MWAIDAKRVVIRKAEDRMDYFIRQMTERPRLAGLWRYWFSWYRVRRADWLTRAYLEQVRAWKRQLRTWERENTLDQHLKETEVIAKNVDTVEDGMKIIQTELEETLTLAMQRNWHIRYPRPQTTMEGWITAIQNRYLIINEWIQRIREELPKAWRSFVYVIYFSYTSPGAERHIEAHFEGMLIDTEKIRAKVKEYSNKLLRAFVAAPRLVAGELRPGYESPLLRAEMAKPPYEGRIISNQNMWQWGWQIGAEINYNVGDRGRIVPSEQPRKIEAKRTVTLTAEVFDYDYVSLRSYKRVEAQARWWELTLLELFELFGIEVER